MSYRKLASISESSSRPQNLLVAVAGLGPLVTVNRRSDNTTIFKRTVNVVDSSTRSAMAVQLWNDDAKNPRVKIGTVLELLGAEVSSWDNRPCLNCTFHTRVTIIDKEHPSWNGIAKVARKIKDRQSTAE